MGYNTRFSVETSGSGDSYKAFLMDGYDEEFGSYDLTIAGLAHGDYEEMKWYDHEDDMKAFSLKWPNVLFTLTGVGEDGGDLWVKHFRNGRVQVAHAKITYDPVDETLLPLDESLEEKVRAERIKNLSEALDAKKRELETVKHQLAELGVIK